MSDLSRFLKSVVIYAGTSAIATAIPVFLLPILTRVLSPADYGLVGMFLIYVNIATAVVGLGLNGALSVRYFQDKFDFPTYTSGCIWLTGLTCLGAGAVYLLFSGLLQSILNMPTQWVLLAICAGGANSILLLRLAIWQAERRAMPFGFLRIVQAGIDIGLSLLLVVVVWQTWQGRAISIAGALMIVGAVSLYSMWRGGYLRRKMDPEMTKDALSFGLPLLPHLLGGLAISFIDRFLVMNLIGLEKLGIYLVAAQIGLILNLIIVSVNRAFAPWLMRLLAQEDGDVRVRIVRVSYLYMAAITVLVAATMAISPWLIRLLATPDFYAAQQVMPYVVLGTGFTAFYYVFTNYLYYANRTGWLSISTLVSAGIAVCVTYVLVQRNGLVGAGQAYAIGQFVTFLLTLIAAQKAYPMPWLKALRGK